MIHISKGNMKLGKIPNISTLPGDAKITNKAGDPITETEGSCSGCCSDCKSACYAMKAVKAYPGARNAWEDNTKLMRYDKPAYFKQIRDYLEKNKPKMFRWNVAGEIETAEDLNYMAEIAKNCPSTQFCVYTKRYSYVKDYLRDKGDFPKNFVVNISVWKDNGLDMMGEDRVNKFIYDDLTDPALRGISHCPAVTKAGKATGVTCDVCKKCYTKGHTTTVFGH